MAEIAAMLSTINITLFLMLFFKDMSGKEELRKIGEELEKMNALNVRLRGRNNGLDQH